MAGPIVYVSHFRVRPGTIEALRTQMADVLAAIEAGKPRTLLQSAFLDEAGSQATFVHVFGDAAAMDAHVEGAAERSRDAAGSLEAAGFELYGSPSDQVIGMLRQTAEAAGVQLVHQPEYVAGFLRLA